MSDTVVRAEEAAVHIRTMITFTPDLGIVLGSGLGILASHIQDPTVIPYSQIPHFPIPTVKGHEGKLVCGSLSGVRTAVMQGRVHHYEGYYMRDVVFPVRVLYSLGIRTIIVANASGGIRDGLMPGDIMAVTDHINMMGTNPLVGIGDEDGHDRFVDLTGAYDQGLLEMARSASREVGLTLKEGVLAAVNGPCYETPAEIRMLRAMGADVVCMSSVPEVIMARYLGMRVLCLSLVTNRAAGLSDRPPLHSDVLDVASNRGDEFAGLIEGVAAMAAGN